MRERTRLWYSASLAMVVLSPPGMIREATLSSCAGFLISTPLTPSLLSAETINKNREIEHTHKTVCEVCVREREREIEDVPAMCSLKDPWRARTPTRAMFAKDLAEWICERNKFRERERERRKPLAGLLFLMALLVSFHWPLCHQLRLFYVSFNFHLLHYGFMPPAGPSNFLITHLFNDWKDNGEEEFNSNYNVVHNKHINHFLNSSRDFKIQFQFKKLTVYNRIVCNGH